MNHNEQFKVAFIGASYRNTLFVKCFRNTFRINGKVYFIDHKEDLSGKSGYVQYMKTEDGKTKSKLLNRILLVQESLKLILAFVLIIMGLNKCQIESGLVVIAGVYLLVNLNLVQALSVNNFPQEDIFVLYRILDKSMISSEDSFAGLE